MDAACCTDRAAPGLDFACVDIAGLDLSGEAASDFEVEVDDQTTVLQPNVPV